MIQQAPQAEGCDVAQQQLAAELQQLVGVRTPTTVTVADAGIQMQVEFTAVDSMKLLVRADPAVRPRPAAGGLRQAEGMGRQPGAADHLPARTHRSAGVRPRRRPGPHPLRPPRQAPRRHTVLRNPALQPCRGQLRPAAIPVHQRPARPGPGRHHRHARGAAQTGRRPGEHAAADPLNDGADDVGTQHPPGAAPQFCSAQFLYVSLSPAKRVICRQASSGERAGVRGRVGQHSVSPLPRRRLLDEHRFSRGRGETGLCAV